MLFGSSTRTLGHKISLLVLGISFVVTLLVGGANALILKGMAYVQSKSPTNVASIDRLVRQGDAALMPVTAKDGSVIGMLVMRKDAGASVIPASFNGKALSKSFDVQTLIAQGAMIKAADAVAIPSEPEQASNAPYVLLLLVGILAVTLATLVGSRLTRGLLEPLNQLEQEVEKLAEGDTNVHISALSRSDEIGRLARAIARIQESLVELARIKTGKGEHLRIGDNLKDLWQDLKSAFRNAPAMLSDLKQGLRNAPEMISAESKTVSVQLSSGWKSWTQHGLGIPARG